MGNARSAWVSRTALACLTGALLAAAPAQAGGDDASVLVFHPDRSGNPTVRAGLEALEDVADDGDFDLDTTRHASAFTPGNLADYRAVVFLNTSGDRLDAAQEAAFQGYVEGGGGFVGIGSAAEAEPGATFFDGLIGARPSATSSPDTTSQTVAVGDRVHPATEDLPLEWRRSDVWYQWETRPTGSVHTVARYHAPDAPAGDGTTVGGSDHPISWCRDFQGGRSFYTGMGRTAASYDSRRFEGHLLGAIQWSAGLVRGNCKATINASYQATRLTRGGDIVTGLATSGESHGVVVAPNGWVLYIGRADCRTDAERGAVFGGPPIGRILDYADPNAGIGCGSVHVWDPAASDGTVNSGVTRAGVLAVHGDMGTGGERTNQPNHKIETGLLGIALAPDFTRTGHVYLQYFPSFNPESEPSGLPLARRISKLSQGRISRFTLDMQTKQLDLDSEVRIFEYDSQIFSCCHRGGGMGFDSEGNLYVTTGDSNSSQGTGGYSGNNQPPTCPTGPPNEPSSAHCGDNAISYQDARRTAGNTNDYNGKLLRFKPIASIPDGAQPPPGPGRTYTIPGRHAPNGPNLFSGREGDGDQAKPEIFAMGLRNPSRLSIDPKTDVPYSAWVGPDAGAPSATLGPSTYESISQVDRAGNYGWPFCMANRQAYRDRIADGTPRTEAAPGYVPGGPAADGTDGWYDCDNLVNDSIRNTGLKVLPHRTGTGMDAGSMRPHNLWYSRGNPGGNGCPDFPRERGASGAPNFGAVNRALCPYLTAQGATVMSGPVYRFDRYADDDSRRWPEYWDGRWFLHNFGGPSVKHAVLLDPDTDQDGGQPVYADSLRSTLAWDNNYMDSKFGPDGALYVQVYQGFFRANPNVGVFRFDYVGGPDTPGPDPQATPAGPRRIAFSIGKSGGVAYRWDFGDGERSRDDDPVHTYDRSGTYDVKLTVTYADGERASKTIPVEVAYVAPRPERGFEYIFDGSATGSDASFDRWAAANGATAVTLDTRLGAMNPNTSGFGMRWYPVRPLGDAVVKLQFMWPDLPGATPNGGVMIRFPDPRYNGTTAEVLAQKPTGYNYDLCPGAAPSFCGRPAPAPSTTYAWPGGDGPYPPPFQYSGAYCARNGENNVTNLAGTGPAVNGGNANNHQHWLSVFCGHEIQVNESLQNPGTDGIKTGSVYGFANLNAKQARTNERQARGVWHEMEIRMVGQQHTVLVDGEVVNQFDNGVPRLASRNGDPPTQARQFPSGYFGLQTHGGTDRIFYREIQVKDLDDRDIPVNTEAPEVEGSGRVGRQLSCDRGEWDRAWGADFGVAWFRANRIGSDHPRLRAPSQGDLGSFSAPAEPEFGTQALPFVGPLQVGTGQRYVPTAEDVGKLIYCRVSATDDGATAWATGSAPPITEG